MNKKITLDMLTQDGVSIKKQDITTIDSKEYTVGEPWRKAYINSTNGRVELQAEVSEPYLSAIMAMWGTTPTVIENTEVSAQ